MKFNPDVHMSVVRNFRAMFKQEEPSLDLSVFSDEKVWSEYEYWCGVEANDDEYPHIRNRYDASVIAGMKESLIKGE